MKNKLEGHEEFIVSHTRKEVMKAFGVNYNYVNNFCRRKNIHPIAERSHRNMTEEMKAFLRGHTIKETAVKFSVPYCWLSSQIRDYDLPHKRHSASAEKLSSGSCKRTGEAHEMIRELSKTFTNAAIARVFGYSRERVRQICVGEEVAIKSKDTDSVPKGIKCLTKEEAWEVCEIIAWASNHGYLEGTEAKDLCSKIVYNNRGWI